MTASVAVERPAPTEPRRQRTGPATAVAIAAGVALSIIALGVAGQRPQALDVLSSLVPPDSLGILIRVVALVGSSVVGGLALTRAVTARRVDNEPRPHIMTPVAAASPSEFIAIFADLSASVSVEPPTADGDQRTEQASAAGAGVAGPPIAAGARPLAWVLAVASAAACLVAAHRGQLEPPPAAGQMALLLAVPMLIGARRTRLLLGLAGLLLLGVVTVQLAQSRSGAPLALALIYAGTASLLISVIALTDRRVPGPTTTPAPPGRRGRDALVILTTAVVTAGLVQLVLVGPRTPLGVVHTGYGATAASQALLPLLAVTIGVVAWWRGQAGPPRPGLLPAGLLALSLAATILLCVLPTPPPESEPGRPLIRSVALGAGRISVQVLPMRPGPNLVHVAGAGLDPAAAQHGIASPPADLRAGTDRSADVPLVPRPGASGTWAVVDIPAGTGSLRISGHGGTAVLPVDVGTEPGPAAAQSVLSGPHGPECAGAVLGAVLPGAWAANVERPWATWCPSQRLSGADARSLRDAVRFLAKRGITGIELVSDGSPRGLAAARVVRSEATVRQVRISPTPAPGDAVVVTSGWEKARATLERVTVENYVTTSGGIVVAPWLLTSGLVSLASSEIVPLTFNPQDREARLYARTLAAVMPGGIPSASGYLERGRPGPSNRPHALPSTPPAAVLVPMGGPEDQFVEMGRTWHSSGAITPTGPPPRTP